MREDWGLPLSFVLHALLPGFEIFLPLSCSQSSASEIANPFQPCSAQASASLWSPVTSIPALLRPPLPRCVGCPEFLSAMHYPLSAMWAVSLSNTSPRPNRAFIVGKGRAERNLFKCTNIAITNCYQTADRQSHLFSYVLNSLLDGQFTWWVYSIRLTNSWVNGPGPRTQQKIE